MSCSSTITSVMINDVSIPIVVAATPEQKTMGLMFRTNLTGGMLFTYEADGNHQFWMKNTLIPLDIIFIDSKNKITGIQYATPCTKDPCAIYAGYGSYVLEVNGNFTKEHNIAVGDVVSFGK